MKYLMGLILIITVFAVACSPQASETITADKACTADSDCVPATCCHPNETVNKAAAPTCINTMCTMECLPETIDCGQGKIKCIENECTAVMK